jgi:hypothetical protein
LWSARTGIGEHPALEDPCPQPTPQQLDHLAVADPALELSDEGVPVDFVEARLDVGVEHPLSTLVGRLTDDLEGVVGGTLGPKAEALGREVRLEYGFEDDLGRRHDHPVFDSWDAERAGFSRPPRLWNMHPS